MAKVKARYNKSEYLKEEERWRAEQDARTLREAMEIKRDKKRLRRARQFIQEQLKALQEAVEDAK
ncbi:MAG TPA: hypothetical protein PLP87_09020 [Clostridiales bacterium]|nr:hypothetical protein [Clostridiales bacterium]